MKHLLPLARQTGSTLIEVLVAVAIAGIMFPALAVAIISANDARPTATQQLVAEGILQGLLTAARSVREQAWTNIDTDGTYHPEISGSSWSLASGSTTTNGFSEQLVVSDVERNSGGDIVSSGGTADPSTKEITATVSWTTPTNSSLSSAIYLTRSLSESSWTQNTLAEFTADTLTNVTVTGGGQAELTPGQASGTVESTTFDAGSSVGFNYLAFTNTVPSGTNVEFQIASNNDNATWNFVGPDGTNSTYYTSPGAIPYSAISGRYFRFLATLTTTNSSDPTINDVTVTYSP